MNLSNEEFDLLKNGNPEVFEKIYNQYKERLYNYFLVKLNGDRTQAGDLLSDTIYSAIKSLHTMKKKNSIQGWFMQIAKHRLMDFFRKRYREEEKQIALKLEHDNIQNDISDDIIKKERSVALQLALENLKPIYATILQMKYFDNNTQKQIAVHIGKSTSAVEGLLYRAREALKKELQKSASIFEEVKS